MSNSNVEALRSLCAELGGTEDLSGATTKDVLNAISGLYNGDTDAETNADAIDSIASVASGIGGGGLSSIKMTVINSSRRLWTFLGAFVGEYESGYTFSANAGYQEIATVVIVDGANIAFTGAEGTSATVSGDATLYDNDDNTGSIYATGDFTITIVNE